MSAVKTDLNGLVAKGVTKLLEDGKIDAAYRLLMYYKDSEKIRDESILHVQGRLQTCLEVALELNLIGT